MAEYADQVARHPFFEAYDKLQGVDYVTQAEITSLKSIVLDVADMIGPHLDRIVLTFPQYTDHSLTHLLNVASHIHSFLPTSESSDDPPLLNALELTYAWLAILLHDVGMFVADKEEKQQIIDSDDFKLFLNENRRWSEAIDSANLVKATVKAEALSDARFAEYIRRKHAERVHAYIEQHLKDKLVFREAPLFQEVGQLCESHAWGVLESNDPHNSQKCVRKLPNRKLVGRTPINMAYLACCLRLGDILDFDRTRTPLSAFHGIHFTEAVSIQEWNKHLSVEGVLVSQHRVHFEAKCDTPTDYMAIQQFLNWIDRELQDCTRLVREAPAEYARRYKLSLSPVVERHEIRMADPRYLAGDFRFELEYEQIMKLLMDKSLYPDESLFLRELLQNALDACRYQYALALEEEMDDKYIPRIQVQDFSQRPFDKEQPENGPCIIFRDNGVGMSLEQVKNFFMRVGKSYYRSPQFTAERDRLKDKGIHLDACSRFGIGFLSCFLGGDRIEVETYRYDSNPLKIRIEGPGRYFVIEKLNPPTRVVAYKSPSNPAEDSPPQCAGTKITIHLRENWRAFSESESEDDQQDIVFKTLEQFAVNQEFPIDVISEDGETRIIPPKRWDTQKPRHPNSRSRKVVSLKQSHQHPLIPAQFSLNQLHPDLKGQGAIWLLDDDGAPVPKKGFLSILGDRVVEAQEIQCVRHVLSPRYSFGFSREKLRQLMKQSPEEPHHFKEWVLALEETEDNRRLKRILHSLSPKGLAWVRGIFLDTSINKNLSHCWDHQAEVEAMLSGSHDLLKQVWQENGVSQDQEGLEINSYNCLSLYGINAPGAFQEWQTKGIESTALDYLPSGVSALVDVCGDLAPDPVASRLYVPADQPNAREITHQVIKGFIDYGNELRRQHPGDPNWENWFRSFLKLDWNSNTMRQAYWGDSFLQIADALTVEFVHADGSREQFTPIQVCERFGDEALVTGLFSKNGVDQLSLPSFVRRIKAYWWLPGVIENFRQYRNEAMKIDLRPLRQVLGL